MRRVLLLIPATSFRTKAFIEAAGMIGVNLTVGSNQSSALAALQQDSFITLDQNSISDAVETVRSFSKTYHIDAVVGVDDESVILSTAIAKELGLHHNSIESVSATRNKFLLRELLAQHAVTQPAYRKISIDEPISNIERSISYPVVVKPVSLAASRGVMRVNDKNELPGAINRIRNLMGTFERNESRYVLIEEYIDGDEVAVEGLLDNGSLRVFAVFDKPDPLTGPFFEETIYTTPSRHKPQILKSIEDAVQRAVHAIGLSSGPIHAEVRFNNTGVYLIELAARSIGGHCSRSLQYVDASQNNRRFSLEEVLLRDALGEPLQAIRREGSATGVMMIPVPARGILREIGGIEKAKKVKYITDVSITAHSGKELIPIPDGGTYPGFIFARAETPERVEQALRDAHALLDFDVG